MSSQIPPLFCQTPPPIDFGDDEDDDVDLPDPEDDDFDDFASIPATTVGSELPTPVSSPFRNYSAPAGTVESNTSQDETTQIHDEAPETIPQTVIRDDPQEEQSRVESPPSLVLSQHNYSENDVPSEDEFQDFAFHPHTAQKDSDIAPGTEDNISIPSLHLDTVSKSETPVQLSENETSERNISPQEPDMEDLGPAPTIEAALTPVVAEDPCYRFDDNTENDFTDFTTASNERSAILEVPTANDVSFDDDFAQLESTPSADSNFVSQSKTDFATFDADFSKFDSFQASFPATFDESGSVPKDSTSTKPNTNTDEKLNRETQREDDLSYDEFDDFQEFAKFPAESTFKPVETIPKDDQANFSSFVEHDNDDDDFGEFNDFKPTEVAPAAATIPTSQSSSFTPECILSVITGVFPACAEEPQSDTGQSDILQDKIYHELKDMDFSKALSFQYNNSESNASLVRALGIDSRNILFGPKWNSSMPRFAANLSFSPLEPLKPSSAGSTANITSNSIVTNSSRTGKTNDTSKHLAFGLDPLQPGNDKNVLQLTSNSATGMVPAVQFDWNSSGLVNPLEGVQEIIQEGSTHQPHKDGPKGEVLDKKITENSGSSASDAVVVPSRETCSTEAIASEVHSLHYGNDTEHINDNDKFELCNSKEIPSIPPTTSPTLLPRAVLPPAESVIAEYTSSSSPVTTPNNLVRTIKLPETHIFTPSKCVNPISRDSTDRTETYGGDARVGDDLDKNIVFREYHDVEYSLEKSTTRKQESVSNPTKREEVIDEFSEFQAVGSDNIYSGTKKMNEQWCSDTHLDAGGEFCVKDKKESMNNYSKPVFGKSPTEELDQMEDEFCEFQTATPVSGIANTFVNKPLTNIASEQIRSNTNSPMLLSPSILLPQQANPTQATDASKTTQINWPDPGIDPEELARFEAAFPKSKTIKSASTSNHSTPKHNPASLTNVDDDDEWTEFVYSKPETEQSAPGKTTAIVCTDNNQSEEWSDFIYSTPSSQNLSSSHNNFNYPSSIASNKLEGPKFNSWNQPQLPPPQFSSWNSSNFYYNSPSGTNNNYTKPPARTQKMPTFPLGHGPTAMNNYHQSASQTATIPSNQPQRIGQSNISGIAQLPELSFITPNLTAGNNTVSGMKPLAHSFLNNVISSNTFAKK